MTHCKSALVFPLLFASILPTANALAQPDPSDWPTYNRDFVGSRFNPGEKTISPQNAGQLEEKWRFPAKDSTQEIGVIHATPAVVNGYVYFGTCTADPTFYKLTPSGKVRWSYRNPAYKSQFDQPAATKEEQEARAVRLRQPREGGILSSALVTDDTVYFMDTGGWIYALDRKEGKERWKLSMRGKGFPGAHPMYLSLASPIMAAGKLIVAGGTLEQVIAAIPGYRGCTGRGFVSALDPKTGHVFWKYDVGPKPEALDPPITIEDGFGKHTFYYGPATSSVWSTPSFDEATGTLFFGTDVNTSPRRPTADDPNMATRDSCAVIALGVDDGKEKWCTQLNKGDVWTNAMPSYEPKEGLYKDQSIGDTPKIFTLDVDGKPTKVVGVGCKNGGFYLIQADDGHIIDHTPLYTGPPSYPLTPERDPRTLALPSPIGGLQTGCATDGKTIYTNGIDALWLAAIQSHDVRKLPSYFVEHGAVTGGRVTALSLDTKTERWRHERPKVASLGGPPPKRVFTDCGDFVGSGIAVGNGVVYFTAVASGKLVALDAKSGQVLKEFTLGPVWSGPSLSRGRVYSGSGNTQFGPGDFEAFFPKKYTGVLYSFGLPGEDEVGRMGEGSE